MYPRPNMSYDYLPNSKLDHSLKLKRNSYRAYVKVILPLVVYMCTGYLFRGKGLVINHGEGGGATKWENRGSETFCAPPQDRVKLVVPPLLKSGSFRAPPTIWLKLQATTYKQPQNLLCPPFSMAKTFSAPPPLFVGVKLHVAPPPPVL